MTTSSRCPDCGGRLFIDPDAETEIPIVRRGIAIRDRALPTVRMRVAVAFCDRCEFSLEIQAEIGR